MQFNVMEYLEHTVRRVPDKIAYANDEFGLTFQEVYGQSRAIGTFLHKYNLQKQPIIVFINRSPKAIAAYYGVIYSGNFYVPLDDEMPRNRIETIIRKINPSAIICDESTMEIANAIDFQGNVHLYDDLIQGPVDDEALTRIRLSTLDTDPLYVVFTSGSTGVPKGIIANHRSVIDYIENLSDVLSLNEDTIFGNQTPLYLDACFKELFPTLKFGATTYIIPKSLFMFPLKLVEFLNKYRINTVCWVVSAFTMISSFKVLDKLVPQFLHTVVFGSEVFPMKQFNLWRRALPNAKFVNLYGPTEATGMSCYYKVERAFEEHESLPIGRPFRNTEILLLGSNDREAAPGEVGEICIRGTCLTLGYYGDFAKTNEVFVQNPLNALYPELIYRTGDLGKYNEHGELMFVSRKDYQIKHMGYRIELGEIEANVNRLEGIKSACCVYDKTTEKIVLFFVGETDARSIVKELKLLLPKYMIPNRIERLDAMPLTTNGKIDRVYLKEACVKKGS
ncbi:amino acid adenylation domain-containing protein [Paenibacillus sp. VMFN-D1]|uniref:amino acid adenylation domain-containing protein n=1 Tax=Paenibacillus sp. VMFN-D1 TaxID=2135608 RepID=UPI000E3AE172|nr:amino acid adenylation domain-containing protein [Paenibacillus sp. VMFN-D1]RED37367.1 amino acid adenylation domain-containing protein [Paenibacillus sp. VMFN-D1]